MYYGNELRKEFFESVESKLWDANDLWKWLADKINELESSRFGKTDIQGIYNAMGYIFHGGEFSAWLDKQEMPFAASKEYDEARNFFIENIRSKFV